MLKNNKDLSSLLTKIKEGERGRFAFVSEPTGSFYLLLVDPKLVPAQEVEDAKKLLGKCAVRHGVLENTSNGPYIFWTKAALPHLEKALKTGLKAVKLLNGATVQLFSKDDDGEVPPDEPGEDEGSVQGQDIDIVELLLAEQLIAEEELAQKQREAAQEQALKELTLKGLEERAVLLGEQLQVLRSSGAQSGITALEQDLKKLAAAQKKLEEGIEEEKVAHEKFGRALKEEQEETSDLYARFGRDEVAANRQRSEEVLKQDGKWWDTWVQEGEKQSKDRALLEERSGDLSKKQEEIAALKVRERRLSAHIPVLERRVEALKKEGAKQAEIQKAEQALEAARKQRTDLAQGLVVASGMEEKLREELAEIDLRLRGAGLGKCCVLAGERDTLRRAQTVEEAGRADRELKESEEALDMLRQEEATLLEHQPALSEATQEWAQVVATLNELKAEREMLKGQSGFFKRKNLFSATRERAKNALQRLPEVEQEIEVVEALVRQAQEKLTLARNVDPVGLKALNEKRAEIVAVAKDVARSRLRGRELQARLRQQEADAARINRDLREQGIARQIEALSKTDKDVELALKEEAEAGEELSKLNKEFQQILTQGRDNRKEIEEKRKKLAEEIDLPVGTQKEEQERADKIKSLREDIDKLLVLQRDNAERRRQSTAARETQGVRIRQARERTKTHIQSLTTSEAIQIQEGLKQLEELSKLEKEAKESAVWALQQQEQAQVDLFVAKQNAASEQDRVGLEQQILEGWALIGRVHNEKLQVDLMTEEGRKKAKKVLGSDYPKLELMQRNLEEKVNGMLIKGASPLEIRDTLSGVPNSLLPPSLRGELETWQQMQLVLDPETAVPVLENLLSDKLQAKPQPLTDDEILTRGERLAEALTTGVSVVSEANNILSSVNDLAKEGVKLAQALRHIQTLGGPGSESEFEKRMEEVWGLVQKGKFGDLFKSKEGEPVNKDGLAKQLKAAQGGMEIAEKVLGGIGLATEIFGDIQGIKAWSEEQDIEKKAEMEDAFFEKLMSLGANTAGFVGSFFDSLPVIGVIKSTLSLLATASARRWHNRYVSLMRQAVMLAGDALATAFEEAMYREKQLLSRYIAKVTADVVSIAGGIIGMVAGGTGIGAAIGAALAIGAGVVKLGAKVGSWAVDKWQMRKRKQLEKRAKEGNMNARIQLFREHPKYAKTMIAKEALRGNGFAKAYCHGHGLSKSMVNKMSEVELMRTLLERHEQTDYFKGDSTPLEHMARVAKEATDEISRIAIPVLTARDAKKAAGICESWHDAVSDAELLESWQRSLAGIIEHHQRLVDEAPVNDRTAMLDLLNDFVTKLQGCTGALQAIYAKTLDVLGVLRDVPGFPDHNVYKDRATFLTAALAGV